MPSGALDDAMVEDGRVRTVDLRPGEDSIRLGQLLKLVDAVPTGAQVKDVLLTGAVRVNGEPEERRGRQLRTGDVVAIEGMEDVRIG
ncbi:RNA-binding S4 domain-containing protein [Geodermatophilus sp. SYSU D00965]